MEKVSPFPNQPEHMQKTAKQPETAVWGGILVALLLGGPGDVAGSLFESHTPKDPNENTIPKLDPSAFKDTPPLGTSTTTDKVEKLAQDHITSAPAA